MTHHQGNDPGHDDQGSHCEGRDDDQGDEDDQDYI